MDAMDGKEPVSKKKIDNKNIQYNLYFQTQKEDLYLFYLQTYALQGTSVKSEDVILDENGFSFVSKCITALEDRGKYFYT